MVYNYKKIKGWLIVDINIDGLNVCYREEGKGKTILLLHGWGATKESLSPFFDALKNDYSVISIDMPGCGKTDEPPFPWSVSDYSDFLNKFITEKKIEPFACLGHSNGGRVLIKACSSWLCPKKLILVDSAGIKAKHSFTYYVKVYSYKLGKKILSMPLINKTHLYEKLIKNVGSSDYKNSSPVMKATMSRLLDEDLTPILSSVKAETLLIWGELDTATPIADGRKMEKYINGAGLVEIKGAGHFSYLDNPGRAISAVRYFLSH